ncbi:hypothetical protein [Streptomyces sp. V4I23]|uniref:hypothetical protein n=1 Tax=Streptomyces sp. V4I23 TaxID=3042282 RepID=UPI0027D908B4|nr:hypothetical protein [Streptomyces sp. V4I23]
MLEDVIEFSSRTNVVKFRGLYVDYTNAGEPLKPDDVTEEQAGWMVSTVTTALAEARPGGSRRAGLLHPRQL